MIKLNETSSSKSRVLSEVELTQVVGGNGHHRQWGGGNHGGNNHSMNNHGRNGNQGNGRGSRQIVIIINNNTTIINNTTLLS
jgi:hypothetical protein